ncbi:hypothetical protein G7L40_21075 [Paenibacillus polymyxa]|nr:hypothetical protein G7035_21125 [Paenibacillus polymyxa]QPK60050.1 hypothetical protein G7L40_21075 [Paenibacillus polymyxa]UOD84360.1 hypothetical protein CUU60_03785 [Paenibacillus polymyxa ATCC 842]WEK65468.1 hypothetical protein ERJ71_14215 [Paenibacillus polymyxa]
MIDMNEQGKVYKRALERVKKGDIDKDYVLLLARRVDELEKTNSKLTRDMLEIVNGIEGQQEEPIEFNYDECAEYIFNKLIEKGIAVSIVDIGLILRLEYEYGGEIGLYVD